MREVAWIEAIDRAGTCRAVTPLELLSDPGRWRAVQYANPVRTASVYRFLTAVWMAAIDYGGIEPYLEAWDDRFWLDHPRHPFYQQAALADTLASAAGPGSVLALDAARATGQNPLLWDHTTADDTVTLTPAEATLLTVTASAALPAGPGTRAIIGKGKAAGWHRPLGPVALTAMVIPYTDNLGDVLDAASYHGTSDTDAPVWERDDDLVMGKKYYVYPTGTMEWLTWPAVQILLGHTDTGMIDSAAVVPGWYPDRDLGVDRADIDPFCTLTTGKKPSILEPKHLRRVEQAQIPTWIDRLRDDGPVMVHFIGQRLAQAKVTGVDQQWRRLDASPEHHKREEPALCQQPLF